jgi:hypothetical protein
MKNVIVMFFVIFVLVFTGTEKSNGQGRIDDNFTFVDQNGPDKYRDPSDEINIPEPKMRQIADKCQVPDGQWWIYPDCETLQRTYIDRARKVFNADQIKKGEDTAMVFEKKHMLYVLDNSVMKNITDKYQALAFSQDSQIVVGSYYPTVLANGIPQQAYYYGDNIFLIANCGQPGADPVVISTVKKTESEKPGVDKAEDTPLTKDDSIALIILRLLEKQVELERQIAAGQTQIPPSGNSFDVPDLLRLLQVQDGTTSGDDCCDPHAVDNFLDKHNEQVKVSNDENLRVRKALHDQDIEKMEAVTDNKVKEMKVEAEVKNSEKILDAALDNSGSSGNYKDAGNVHSHGGHNYDPYNYGTRTSGDELLAAIKRGNRIGGANLSLNLWNEAKQILYQRGWRGFGRGFHGGGQYYLPPN